MHSILRPTLYKLKVGSRVRAKLRRGSQLGLGRRLAARGLTLLACNLQCWECCQTSEGPILLCSLIKCPMPATTKGSPTQFAICATCVVFKMCPIVRMLRTLIVTCMLNTRCFQVASASTYEAWSEFIASRTDMGTWEVPHVLLVFWCQPLTLATCTATVRSQASHLQMRQPPRLQTPPPTLRKLKAASRARAKRGYAGAVS